MEKKSLSRLVVEVLLAANTLVALRFGKLIPMLLKGMRSDRALASRPLLTAIIDIVGSLLYRGWSL